MFLRVSIFFAPCSCTTLTTCLSHECVRLTNSVHALQVSLAQGMLAAQPPPPPFSPQLQQGVSLVGSSLPPSSTQLLFLAALPPFRYHSEHPTRHCCAVHIFQEGQEGLARPVYTPGYGLMPHAQASDDPKVCYTGRFSSRRVNFFLDASNLTLHPTCPVLRQLGAGDGRAATLSSCICLSERAAAAPFSP